MRFGFEVKRDIHYYYYLMYLAFRKTLNARK